MNTVLGYRYILFNMAVGYTSISYNLSNFSRQLKQQELTLKILCSFRRLKNPQNYEIRSGALVEPSTSIKYNAKLWSRPIDQIFTYRSWYTLPNITYFLHQTFQLH